LDLTEKTLANQVEKTGNQLQTQEFLSSSKPQEMTKLESISSIKENADLLYVGVDGVMTPLNQKQGYKEAKVGVVFWSKDRQKVNGKRGIIRQREYSEASRSH
jgi:carboxypeptidase C (cathepsin A)